MKARIKHLKFPWHGRTLTVELKPRTNHSTRVGITLERSNTPSIYIELTQTDALALSNALVDCAEELDPNR